MKATNVALLIGRLVVFFNPSIKSVAAGKNVSSVEFTEVADAAAFTHPAKRRDR